MVSKTIPPLALTNKTFFYLKNGPFTRKKPVFCILSKSIPFLALTRYKKISIIFSLSLRDCVGNSETNIFIFLAVFFL